MNKVAGVAKRKDKIFRNGQVIKMKATITTVHQKQEKNYTSHIHFLNAGAVSWLIVME